MKKGDASCDWVRLTADESTCRMSRLILDIITRRLRLLGSEYPLDAQIDIALD